ncbi:MAG: hypothetical protein E5Y68_00790 [Mesorhizobium sp.]|nr:MAG: hypothetical protein E5Y68_00790 [Mesorhizobium sp.]
MRAICLEHGLQQLLVNAGPHLTEVHLNQIVEHPPGFEASGLDLAVLHGGKLGLNGPAHIIWQCVWKYQIGETKVHSAMTCLILDMLAQIVNKPGTCASVGNLR